MARHTTQGTTLHTEEHVERGRQRRRRRLARRQRCPQTRVVGENGRAEIDFRGGVARGAGRSGVGIDLRRGRVRIVEDLIADGEILRA